MLEYIEASVNGPPPPGIHSGTRRYQSRHLLAVRGGDDVGSRTADLVDIPFATFRTDQVTPGEVIHQEDSQP